MQLNAPSPIGKGNIAKPVPLAAADKKQQDIYMPLAAALAEEGGVSAEPPDPALLPAEPPASPWEPSEDDKKNFVRTLLGGGQYEKTYRLFNGMVVATFKDRTTQQCEDLYAVLRSQQEMNAFPESDYALWEARYHLAATLCKLELDGRRTADLAYPTELPNRITELMEHPSPLYQALMAASDHFERHLNLMIGSARTDSFWQTDGTASR